MKNCSLIFGQAIVTINITVLAKTNNFIISNASREERKDWKAYFHMKFVLTDPPACADSPRSRSLDPCPVHPFAQAAAVPCCACPCPRPYPCFGRVLCRVRYACVCRSPLMYWQRPISSISLHPIGAEMTAASAPAAAAIPAPAQDPAPCTS